VKLIFACKDLSIAQYCDARFRRQFERDLDRAQTRGSLEQTQRVWQRRLTKEAARQEWFDYTEDEFGTRVVISDADGKPVLLVPELLLSEQES
jgi:hypothetical protein